MNNSTYPIIDSFVFVFFLLLLCFAGVLVKIIFIEYVERDKWLAIADVQIQRNRVVPARRGTIYDSQGMILSATVPKYVVYMDTRVTPLHQGGDTLFHRHINELSSKLSSVIGDQSASAYKRNITKAFYAKRGTYKVTNTHINLLQKKEIETLDIVKRGRFVSGIIFEEKKMRIFPYGDLAKRTIGNVDYEGTRGLYGIEHSYNDVLCGKNGVATRQRVGKRREDVIEKSPLDGSDVVTSIDIRLQDIVESELKQRLNRTQAQWGCCILMETNTGLIRAICNLDKTSSGNYEERLNHAVLRIEPGSTFKTVALLAALDDGKTSINAPITISKKPWSYNGSTHTDAHPKDTTFSIRNAFACSSNIAQAKIITKAFGGDAKKMIDKIRSMGVLDTFLFPIQGSQSPLLNVPHDSMTISKMSYGYSVEVSPLWLTVFYNAIAMGGKMVAPLLISEVRHSKGKIERMRTQILHSTIATDTAIRDIRLCLHDVVWDNALGTASVSKWGSRLAQSRLVSIAGKTGTAQILEDGRYRNDKHRISFVGYFPEEQPLYTCLCMINAPQNRGAYDAGFDCGITVRNIAEKVIAITHHYQMTEGKKVIEKSADRTYIR